MKLGSLFDGSGGFPLAASLCGITPVWASEVEPYPIAVTMSRFPNMEHLGDIDEKEIWSDDEVEFWQGVRNTYDRLNGKNAKYYVAKQIRKWYEKLRTKTDSAEYKMWGNGIALPCALYVMQGIADAMAKKGDRDERQEKAD